MPDSLINIHNLTLQLEGKIILHDVSLDIARGEYLALVGPNGAGKTSLIKCLARIHHAWQGEIMVDGRNLRRCSRRILSKSISYAPQAEGYDIPFSGMEFVLMSRYPYLSPFTTLCKPDRDLAEQCMEQTGTINLRDRQINTLSGGERQMVLIAAALAQGAEIMLLDEPTAFLDYHHQQRIMRMLGELNRKRGLTIIAVSHDVNAACRWSTRIAAMRNGRLLFCKTPEEMLRQTTLAAVYDTQFNFARMPDGRKLAVVEDAP